MHNNALEVLGRMSHQLAANVGSLTGRMIAVENPQTLTNMNRVHCQAGLLFQQQRRLDDPSFNAYIRAVLEARLGEEDTEVSSVLVRRQMTLLAHQTLLRLQCLVQSAAAADACVRTNETKTQQLQDQIAAMEKARSRFEVLTKNDALAASINAACPPTAETQAAARGLETAIQEKQAVVERAAAVSAQVKTEMEAFRASMKKSLDELQLVVDQLNNLTTAP